MFFPLSFSLSFIKAERVFDVYVGSESILNLLKNFIASYPSLVG